MKKRKLIGLIVAAVMLLAFSLLSAFIRTDVPVDCDVCGGHGLSYALAADGAGETLGVVHEICPVCDGRGANADCTFCGGAGNGYLVCGTCGGAGEITEDGVKSDCADCDVLAVEVLGTCESCGGAGTVKADSNYYATFMALVPPLIAIVLALITKEVYSSLFVGILAGALLYVNFHPVGVIDAIVKDGFLGALADDWDVGILIFLVLLGIMVSVVNRAGGSQAFGKWAETHVKTRVGAQLATFALGCLIFIDDYFNCLTVGSVMRPLADSHKVSRAKLAYLIDATAAPICMIAPISSWAAAVSGVMDGDETGLTLFVKAIPYNFYSLLTIVMIVAIILLKVDFGPMRRHEKNALAGDLYTEGDRADASGEGEASSKGRVIDLVFPVLLLIVCCVVGMIYTGGFFEGTSFTQSFANSDASVGLPWGALIALVITLLYFICRRSLSFSELMGCVPKGFCAMVPAILILSFAWTLNGMTNLLGAKVYVANLMENSASSLAYFLPAIIFLVGLGLAFATGTSWGTFGILIPIVTAVFAKDPTLMVIGVSACLAGAVCGDHCSPISDTTIMASAGAQCNHVNHVSTQLPYALTVAAVSFAGYVITGLLEMAKLPFATWYISLPIGILLMVGVILVIRGSQKRRDA